MPQLALERLHAHPENANRMPVPLLAKLIDHIRDTGDYPPIIVRRHPDRPDHYQILDGYHRAEALRSIGGDCAHCEIWEADDDRARLLLLTLNRLQGDDDPQLRGSLLGKLAQSIELKELASLLPDDLQRIQKLIELNEPPPPPADPPEVENMPHAVTFFLNAPQRRRLLSRLRDAARDRSEALVKLLELDV